MSNERRGMCKRCTMSELRVRKGAGAWGTDQKYLYCHKYASTCQQVARNCPGPIEKDKQ